jgi:hypothetical protein
MNPAPVILGVTSTSRSEVLAESKDLYSILSRCDGIPPFSPCMELDR